MRTLNVRFSEMSNTALGIRQTFCLLFRDMDRTSQALLDAALVWMRAQKLDQTGLAAALGENNSATITNWKRRGIPEEKWLRVANLIGYNLQPGLGSHVSPAPDQPDYDKYAFLTRIKGVQLSAGPGRVNYEVDEIDHSHAFRRDWLTRKGLHAKRCHIVEVTGDSMSPTLPNGCVVLVDTSDITPIKNGKLYAIVADGKTRVKRLVEQPDGTLEVRSDNPAPDFPTEIFAPQFRDRVIVIGRVRWHSAEDD